LHQRYVSHDPLQGKATPTGEIPLTGAQLAKAAGEIAADRETVASMAALFGVNRLTLWRALRDRASS